VRVSALHVGYMDTDMARSVEAEVVADDISRSALAGLSGGVAALYPQVV
jgi:hypothetical protein